MSSVLTRKQTAEHVSSPTYFESSSDVILDMGHTRILRLVGGALGSGGLGWFGGSVYQKYLNLKQDQRSHHLPGLPSEASVSVGSLTLGCHPPASIQAEIRYYYVGMFTMHVFRQAQQCHQLPALECPSLPQILVFLLNLTPQLPE